MPLVQILLTAASLAAAGAGTWGADRLVDRLARDPSPVTGQATAEARPEEDEDRDGRLTY